MNGKLWVPLLLAGAMGVVAAKVGRNMLNGRSPLTAQGNLISVVVAANDLEPGHEITSSDVKSVRMPLEAVPKGGFARGDELEGRVVTSQVVLGQAVLEPVLAPKGSGRGAPSLVPIGMRAVSVDVSESTAVGGLLVPGCHVDIICTMSEEKSGMKVTRTIVENADVLAVGQRLSSAVTAAPQGGVEPPMARTVTLLVPPKEAQAIELATSLGRARLVLRGSLDKETGLATGLTIGELLGMSEMGMQARTPQSGRMADATTQPSQQKWTMEVFKDGVRSMQQLDQARMAPTEITTVETGPVSSKQPAHNESGERTSAVPVNEKPTVNVEKSEPAGTSSVSNKPVADVEDGERTNADAVNEKPTADVESDEAAGAGPVTSKSTATVDAGEPTSDPSASADTASDAASGISKNTDKTAATQPVTKINLSAE